MKRNPVFLLSGLLAITAVIAAWPSADQTSWAGTKALAAALVPVLSAMFGALLAVHGYEVREERALRRRQIEQMFRAGHTLVVRLHDLRAVGSESRPAAAQRVNDAVVELAMYVRLYGSSDFNLKLDKIMASLNAAVRPLGPPDPEGMKPAYALLDEMSETLKGLSKQHFRDERIG